MQIKISADEKSAEKVKTTSTPGRRSILNKHVKFDRKVNVELIQDLILGTIKIGNNLTVDAERLPHEDRKGSRGHHRGLLFVEGAFTFGTKLFLMEQVRKNFIAVLFFSKL
jgi:hypothetical protein